MPRLAVLEHAAVDAFGAVVNAKAPALLASISRASHFATIDQGRGNPEVVIDRRALLLGVLDLGFAQPGSHISSAWLVSWLVKTLGHSPYTLKDLVYPHLREGDNLEAVRGGAKVVLSVSVRGLLPRAVELAGLTVKRRVIDLRHLVFAFVEKPGREWDLLPRTPSAHEFALLRAQIVEEILRGAEPHENVAAWRDLVRHPAQPASSSETDGDFASVSAPPGGTPVVDAEALEAMREAFLARFPDFHEKGFGASDGGYWEVERAYKQQLIDGAAEIMGREDLEPPRRGAALLDLLKDCNLLGWREWRRMEEIENSSLIPLALGELVGAEDVAEGVGRFVEAVAEDYLKGREGNMPYADLRSIPTTVLALARPADAIAVRYTTMHRAGMRLTGGSLFKNAPMTAQEYRAVLALAHHIEKVMREAWGWRPRDLWDVQGFLWVVTEGPEKEAAGTLDDVAEEASGDAALQHDHYRTQADDPARLDTLERGPFARVLAARIVEVRRSLRGIGDDDDRAFMVHLHGPWGSGKSSLLNLLQHELEHPAEIEAPHPQGGKAGPALVIWFNAWKHQRMRPPWWALMSAIYRGALRRCAEGDDKKVRRGERLALWRLWWTWRWKAEVFPILLVVLLVGGLSFALLGTEGSTLVETIGKIGTAALVVLAAVYGYARLMIFGSQKAVQAYADLTTDPYRRIVDLFNRLVDEISPPLVVFIDDLDRCGSDYVVELLEGIQTLFRHAPVTYVVAADRKWICSSFEKKYGDFTGSIGEPCRPLGYLFLDKLFQISAGMPRLTPEIQQHYLDALLADHAPVSAAPDPVLVEEAKERMAGKSDEAEIEKVIAASSSPEEERANRAAGALQIATAVAREKTEHRLKKLGHLIEPNPRSMKQLVNRVAMEQARGILEGRISSPETRARWAMLSLRWPVLAEFIAENPEMIAHWKKPEKTRGRPTKAKADPTLPEAVRTLHGSAAVMNVVGGEGEDGALTIESLAPLLA